MHPRMRGKQQSNEDRLIFGVDSWVTSWVLGERDIKVIIYLDIPHNPLGSVWMPSSTMQAFPL